jgi:hypothetical protein
MNILQYGLILNIIGTILIFLCGFPSKIEESKSSGLLSIGDVDEEEYKKRTQTNKRIKFGGYLGISFLIIGFILQFIDTTK